MQRKPLRIISERLDPRRKGLREMGLLDWDRADPLDAPEGRQGRPVSLEKVLSSVRVEQLFSLQPTLPKRPVPGYRSWMRHPRRGLRQPTTGGRPSGRSRGPAREARVTGKGAQ